MASDAVGIDRMGNKYAENNSIPLKKMGVTREEWSKSRGAGLQRNTEMVEYVDQIIAIWDGKSKGTKDSIDKARKSGKPVYVHIPK